MKRYTRFGLLLFFVVLVSIASACHTETPATICSPNGAGVLTTVKGKRVLSLKGTHYEMGYAQGYLLANDILNILNNFIIKDIITKNKIPSLLEFITIEKADIPQRYKDETRGLYDGLVASGVPMKIDAVDKDGNPIIADLNFVYATLFIMDYTMIACSSFSAWNSLVEDKSIITGRNDDFLTPSQKGSAILQIIRTFHSTEGDEERLVSVGFPGAIGVNTGINERGISITSNKASNGSSPATSIEGRIAIALAMREFLETKKPETGTGVDGYAESFFESKKLLVPGILHIGSVYDINSNPTPAVALEVDAQEVVVRRGTDDNLVDHIIATNHWMKRQSSQMNLSNSIERYNTIATAIHQYSTSDDTVIDVEEAKEILREVSPSQDQLISYESIIFLPAQMKIYLALAKYQNGTYLSAPFTNDWTEYNFDELFLLDTAPAGH